jgi:molybdopterin synthase sulfur carrier subunit
LMVIQVLYFAWVRERIGIPKEDIVTNAGTVMELVSELKQKDERYALAFSDLSSIRVALDLELADFETSISGIKEVAFFPPMTGG